MTQLAIVTEAMVRELVTRDLAFDAIRAAYESVANGAAEVFDVVMCSGLEDGQVFGVKSGKDALLGAVGLKVGSYYPGNAELGLPAHGSTTLLLDPDTGFPQALINSTLLNGYRTAAGNAVATDQLARSDARVLGVIGAGHQAEHEIRAVCEVREIKQVKIATRSASRAQWILERLADLQERGIEVCSTDFEDAVRESDIVVTVTPSREPLVRAEWVAAGTHISAMGADQSGKIELDPELCSSARLFADLPRQSISIGEFETAFQGGQIDAVERIVAVGLLTQGKAPGRENGEQVTIFDSSGIAIQDLVIANRIMTEAERSGRLERINF